MAKKESIKLKVGEALQDDVYKGIARIDSNSMKFLNVNPGDVIMIKGSRETFAIVDRAYPADIGQGIIRIDGTIRKNAKTGMGESVTVEKAEVKEAKKVIIAPAQKGIIVQTNNPEGLKRGLLGRTVVQGDIVILGGTSRRRNLMEDSIDFDKLDEIFGRMLGGGGMSGLPNLSGMPIKFVVVNTNPLKTPVVITESTELTLNPKAVDLVEEISIDISYEDIGGLNEEIMKIREMVELPLKHPEIFEKLGIEPPKGVLLFGPPGTGKTLLAKAVANESEAHFILLNGPEIMSKFYGESEKKIRDIFEQAEKNAPSIIFIDELDSIATQREESYGEVERRVVSQLLTMMDGLKSRGKVIVIAATNRPNVIDPALRRPGRFDREININAPNKQGRLDILKIHTRNMPMAKDVNLERLAEKTHGFVGADLSALTKEAAMNVLRRVLPDLKLKKKNGEETDVLDEIPEETLKKLIVYADDFEQSLRIVRPSAMREVLIETPNVKWDDVGGLEKTKQELIESIEWPLKYPDNFKRMGIRPPKGLLLYGPPGTGKTMLAKAVAKESEANFIHNNGPSLLNKWVGESEKGIRKIFERARQVSPAIIFFDEIDAIASKRGRNNDSNVTERVLNQLLTEMDGLTEMKEIVVIGATNRPDMLDNALLRPGRFDRILFIPVPDKKGREDIFKIHTKNMPLAKDVSIKEIVEKTEGAVGADIEGICREAGMLALREDVKAKEVKKKHFEEAIKKIGCSVADDDIKKYKDIEQKYLRSAKAALEKPGYYG